MQVKGGQGRLWRVRPAKPLKPRRNLGIVQISMIAAVRADELEHIGVAAFEAAVHDADRLAAQGRRVAVAGLTAERDCGEWDCIDAVGPGEQPWVTAIVRAWHGDGGRTGTGPYFRVATTAHSTHRLGQ